MTAPLFFVEGPIGERGSTSLSPEDSRHALRALRLQPGEDVTVSDGRGTVADGRLRGEDHGLAVVEVLDVRRVVRPGPEVSIAMAPPKGDRLSWAIQKLAEVGVDRVILMRTERSIRTWGAVQAERAVSRLRAVAREAAMQSRRPFVTDVDGGTDLPGALEEGGASRILLSEGTAAPLSASLPDRPAAIRLLIGPEGGFTESEVEMARAAGASVAGLGPGILRTETAALVGATLVLARYGRLG